MTHKNLLNLMVLFMALAMIGCSGGINKSGQSSSESASTGGMSVEEVAKETIATADKDIPNTVSIVGDIPELLTRREYALGLVNEWMSKNQIAVAKEDHALDKSLAYAAARDKAFDLVIEHYTQLIEENAKQLADNEVPLEVDSRYFTGGTAKIREIGESLVYFSYDIKAVEDRKGYYRVMIEYLDENGNVLSSNDALSASIITEKDGPVCRFDRSATVTDLENCRKLKVTLQLE